MLHLNDLFFFFSPGKGCILWNMIQLSASSEKKKKNHLSKHMDVKSVPLILFYTIWHFEFLEDQ